MASGSSTASKQKKNTQLLEGFQRLIEKAKEIKEYEVIAPKKNYPTSPPPSHAKEDYYKDKKKTGPGHEASGAGAGGGDDGGDGDGGHVYARPKKGFIFCLKCREYIRCDEFDDHVNEHHHPMDGDESDDD